MVLLGLKYRSAWPYSRLYNQFHTEPVLVFYLKKEKPFKVKSNTIKNSICKRYGVNTPENRYRYRLLEKFSRFSSSQFINDFEDVLFQLDDNHSLESITTMLVLAREH